MRHTVELSPRALRDLGSFKKNAAKEILDDLEILKDHPWPPAPKVKKLAGQKGQFRLRTGNYRSVFELMGEKVVVLRVMDRKELERSLKNI